MSTDPRPERAPETTDIDWTRFGPSDYWSDEVRELYAKVARTKLAAKKARARFNRERYRGQGMMALAKAIAQDKAKGKRTPKSGPRRNYHFPTAKQLAALVMVDKCGGNVRAAARQLKRGESTVRQHYEAALRNVGKTRPAFARAGKLRTLSTDHRGQVTTQKPRDAR